MAVIVFGPGLDYWRSAIRGGEEAVMPPPTGGVREDQRKREHEAPRSEAPKRAPPAEQPARPAPPPTASISCDAMPKTLAGAFAETSDCALIERTLRQALATAEPGTITRWTNTRTAMSGTIKLSGAETRDGTVCRRAELTVTRGAETKRAEAVLCLKQGTWILVE